MSKLSLVCCYNKRKLYEKLLESISYQNIQVDIIGIDNTNNLYKSCSEAYNYALKSVKTEFVLFVHQDIIFLNTENLKCILRYLEMLSDYDLLGLVGARTSDVFVSTNVYVGDVNNYGGERRVCGLEETQTLDECIFGGHTKCFIKYPFDEEICDNWHLYAVERCLASLNRNDKVYVCDVSLLHLSAGNVDSTFDDCFIKICKKYRNDFDEIRTPCALSKTSSFYLMLWKFKSVIKRLIK